MVYHWVPERFRWLENTYKHPLHMVGTDGVYNGLKPHPRGYGSYPKVLKEFVRDNGWLTLESAICKMSGYPAARFGIQHRGTLKVDNYADIVVFDPDRISDGPTFEAARKPNKGFDAVLVNGKPIIRHDE